MLTLKKLTPYNLLIKWPKIIIRRGKEKIKNSRARMILFYDKPVVLTDVYGLKFINYPWDKTPLEKLLSRRIYTEEIGAIKKLVGPGGTVFDVGANVGFMSCFLAKTVGPEGKVFAFEPVQETYYQLRENLAVNHLENVQAYRLAIYNKKEELTMNLFPPSYSGWNSLGRPKFKELTPTRTEKTPADTLDNFCIEQRIEKIDFLKIDVEGFEKYVLWGAEQLLKDKKVTALSFEISRIPLQGSGVKAKEVFDLLDSYGYQCYQFSEEDNTFSGPVRDSDEFLANYYASYQDLTKI